MTLRSNASRSIASEPFAPSRSVNEWRAALDTVSESARDGTNLVPPIIAAVEAKATLGEISDAMRSVFGEYQETATL